MGLWHWFIFHRSKCHRECSAPRYCEERVLQKLPAYSLIPSTGITGGTVPRLVLTLHWERRSSDSDLGLCRWEFGGCVWQIYAVSFGIHCLPALHFQSCPPSDKRETIPLWNPGSLARALNCHRLFDSPHLLGFGLCALGCVRFVVCVVSRFTQPKPKKCGQSKTAKKSKQVSFNEQNDQAQSSWRLHCFTSSLAPMKGKPEECRLKVWFIGP